MTSGNPYLDAALAAYRAGLSVLPPAQDGSKQPHVGGWARYQVERATEQQIREWYANGRTGVGAVMGGVSQRTELFEFDDYATYEAYRQAARSAGLSDLVERVERGYSERTPGGGVHWFYRCPTERNSTKLARRALGDGKFKVLVETKGHHGYAVMAPSCGGVHPSGRPYELLQGGPASIAEISDAERDELWRLARSFDETPARDTEAPVREAGQPAGNGARPGDVFAQRTSWRQVLEPHGWRAVYQRNGVTFWRRPGKDRGISATTNYRDTDLLYVFSTSTVFESERGYNKFSAFALLNHGGDYRAAAVTLAALGYRTADTTYDFTEPEAWTTQTDAEGVTRAVNTASGEAVELPGWTVHRGRVLRSMDLPPIEWLIDRTIPCGRYVVLSGESGLGKSWWALALALCAGREQPFLGRDTIPARTLYIDEENGIQEAQRRLRALADGMGIPEDEDLPVDFLIDESVKLSKPVHTQALIRLIKDEGYTLIITDSLIRFFDGNENNSDEVAKFHAAVDAIRKATGITWIMLQHLNKAGKDGGAIAPGDRIRGSGEFKAHADVHVQLQSLDSGVTIITHVEKLRGSVRPDDVAYRLEGNTMLDEPVVLTVIGSTAAAHGAEQAALMYACELLDNAGALTVGELLTFLKERYGVSTSTAERGVRLGRKSGAIVLSHKAGKNVFLKVGIRNVE